jgi:hypothetical protein
MAKSQQQTTFSTSRSLVNTVNHHMPFSYAKNLGYCPKKMYFHIQDFGFARVKQVLDFYVSIHKENPSFFWFNQYGEVDGQDNPVKEAERFRRYLFTTIKQNKPLLEKFAGRYYFDQGWGDASGKAKVEPKKAGFAHASC